MPNRTVVALALCCLAVLGSSARASGDPDAVRRELLQRINALRGAKGVPAIALVPQLDRVAQEHADEMAARGSIHGTGGSAAMRQRLEKVGYAWSEYTENVSATNGDLDDVFQAWRTRNTESYERLLSPAFTNLGIGLAEMDGTAIYDFLLAVPEGEEFGRRIESLKDLPRVRAGVLAATNAERRRMRVPALSANHLLDRAAQAHAEDMLARSFFEHRNPDGRTVRQRADAQGYTWMGIGENLAEGQPTVDEAMAGWMKSPEHRHNILDRDFTELGVGLAYGKDRKSGRYRVLWVQVFGTPR